MIDRNLIETLARFNSEGSPAVSFYLDVDGREYSPHQNAVRARQLVRLAHDDLPRWHLSDKAAKSAHNDLERISQYVTADFERMDTRGLAIFACAARQFWQVVPLAVPVKDHIAVESQFIVRPLATLLSDYPSFGLVMVTRDSARLFVIECGKIAELEPVKDEVHERFHVGRAEQHLERNIEKQLHLHLEHVAARVCELVQSNVLDRLLVFGTSGVLPEFMETLPREIAAKVVNKSDCVTLDLPAQDVLATASEPIAKVLSSEQASLVETLQDASGPNGTAVEGLESTLHALYRGAIRTLILDRELSQSGYVCGKCGRLYCSMAPCPECFDAEYIRPVDLVEEAVQAAYKQGAEVKFVAAAQGRSVSGGLAALLHFPVQPALQLETQSAIP